MHERVGTPSTSTVHAPQWPSPHATFVPVSISSSRSASASVVPTSERSSYPCPLIVSSGSGCHRLDVGQVDQAEREAGRDAPFRVVFDVGQFLPEIARCHEQLMDAFDGR